MRSSKKSSLLCLKMIFAVLFGVRLIPRHCCAPEENCAFRYCRRSASGSQLSSTEPKTPVPPSLLDGGSLCDERKGSHQGFEHHVTPPLQLAQGPCRSGNQSPA